MKKLILLMVLILAGFTNTFAHITIIKSKKGANGYDYVKFEQWTTFWGETNIWIECRNPGNLPCPAKPKHPVYSKYETFEAEYILTWFEDSKMCEKESGKVYFNGDILIVWTGNPENGDIELNIYNYNEDPLKF